MNTSLSKKILIYATFIITASSTPLHGAAKTKPCEIPGMIGEFDATICLLIEQLIQLKLQLTDEPSLATELTQRRRDPSLKLEGDELDNRFLFEGHRGVGKSQAVAFIAQSIGAELKTVKASTLITPFQGSGSASVEETFAWIKKQLETNKFAMVLFEEIDAIASKDARPEYRSAMQTLWACLDEYNNDPRVIIICTTNQCDNLDETFLSRFGSNIISFELPKKAQRSVLFFNYLVKAALPKIPANDLEKIHLELVSLQKPQLTERFKQEIQEPLLKQHQNDLEEIKKLMMLSDNQLDLPSTSCLRKNMSSQFLQTTEELFKLILETGVNSSNVEKIKNYMAKLTLFYKNNNFLFEPGWTSSPFNKLVSDSNKKDIRFVEHFCKAIRIQATKFNMGLITSEAIETATKKMARQKRND